MTHIADSGELPARPAPMPAEGTTLAGSGLLAGHSILVTGGTQGLGRAVAIRAAHEGARSVVLIGRNAEAGAGVASEVRRLGSEAHFIPADLADREACLRLVPDALELVGSLDGLVNAAGITTRGTWSDTDPDVLDLHLAVNLRAPFLLLQGFISHRVEVSAAGSAVTVATMSGHGGQPFLAPYATSKAGIFGMTKNAAHAHRWDRIRVNALNIGWTKTEGEDTTQRTFHGADDGWLADAEASVPFGQLGDPEQIAESVAYLLSPRSGVVTGSVIDWDQNVVGASD